MFHVRSHARLILSLAVLVVCAAVWPASATDLKLSTSSLSFVAVAGTTPAPQQFVAYSDPASSNFAPSVSATTQSGGQWLVVTTAAGGSYAGNVNVAVSVKSWAWP